jgi:hypothetical protein
MQWRRGRQRCNATTRQGRCAVQKGKRHQSAAICCYRLFVADLLPICCWVRGVLRRVGCCLGVVRCIVVAAAGHRCDRDSMAAKGTAGSGDGMRGGVGGRSGRGWVGGWAGLKQERPSVTERWQPRARQPGRREPARDGYPVATRLSLPSCQRHSRSERPKLPKMERRKSHSHSRFAGRYGCGQGSWGDPLPDCITLGHAR